MITVVSRICKLRIGNCYLLSRITRKCGYNYLLHGLQTSKRKCQPIHLRDKLRVVHIFAFCNMYPIKANILELPYFKEYFRTFYTFFLKFRTENFNRRYLIVY